MQKNQNAASHVKAILFVDFKPAEIKLCKEWIIVYYAKNPITQRLERFRLRVPVMKERAERLRHAKRIVFEINNKLYSGWSPFFEESAKSFKSFENAVDDFIAGIDKLVQDNILRPDTKRTYTSNSNLLKKFVAEKTKIKFAIEINQKFCNEYADWIYYDRKSSPRTRNNHVEYLSIFCNFLLQRGVLGENPVKSVARLKLPSKKRVAFPLEIKAKINQYFETLSNGFPAVCMTTYFCFIRNSELKNLRVKDVDLKNASIFLSKDFSKNKKDEIVTIPDNFMNQITIHIGNANLDDYVFSANNFLVGKTIMPVRKIGSAWDKLRNKLKLESKYQFYGFKDTGIQDLLNSGMPAIKVRDQARHSEIAITEIYAQRNNVIDQAIKTHNLQF